MGHEASKFWKKLALRGSPDTNRLRPHCTDGKPRPREGRESFPGHTSSPSWAWEWSQGSHSSCVLAWLPELHRYVSWVQPGSGYRRDSMSESVYVCVHKRERRTKINHRHHNTCSAPYPAFFSILSFLPAVKPASPPGASLYPKP